MVSKLSTLLLNGSNELYGILKKYYHYLINNHIYSEKSLDYIFEIIDLFEIEKRYFELFSFDENLKSNGVFLPNKKSIILNIKDLLLAKNIDAINIDTFIIEYFILLLHEINHLMQYKYMNELNDNISNIMRESAILRRNVSNIRNYHDMFPDEIDSHIRSSNIVNSFINNYCELIKNSNISEKRLIYFISLGIINDKEIINSQFDYIHKLLLGNSYNKSYNELPELLHIYYGLEKKNTTMNKIISSYQTQKLCLDINERRF